MPAGHATSNAVCAEAEVINLGPRGAISTGICFLDHMVDQLTSHAQLGVTLRVSIAEPAAAQDAGSGAATKARKQMRQLAPNRDYAAGQSSRPHDRDIFITVGTALGAALRGVVEEAVSATACGAPRGSAVFCCPLDEAFAEATIDLLPPPERAGHCAANLAPYGKFASGAGRQWVGRYRTELTPLFWSALAGAMRGELSLCKVRGANAHHILEATFKSFARAFRAALDGVADGQAHGCVAPHDRSVSTTAPSAQPSVEAPSAAIVAEPRRARRQRATKETTIEVRRRVGTGGTGRWVML